MKLEKTPHLFKDLKGYSVGVDFPYKEIDFDPYVIGYWLGDETESSTQIQAQDSAVLKYLVTTLPSYDCYLQYEERCSTNYHYRINSLKHGYNLFTRVLKNHDMINNKHIPSIYKSNSRSVRLALLAGIIDSDGYLLGNVYEIAKSIKHQRLVRDIIFLIKSLGFCVKNIKSLTYEGEKKPRPSYRIFFSGTGIEEIPVKISSKKSNPRETDERCSCFRYKS